MSTHDVLTQAVTISGRLVQPQLGTLEEVAEQARQIAPGLRSEEEKQILRISKVARKNLPLINLNTAMRAGGLDAKGLPRLAICSYSMSLRGQPVSVRVSLDGSARFSWWRNWDDRWAIEFPEDTFPRGGFLEQVFLGVRGPLQTATPAMPGALRQKNTRGVILLFEVPLWERIKIQILEGDPYLLRHVAGNVYAVLGTWDITDLEVKVFQASRDLGFRS